MLQLYMNHQVRRLGSANKTRMCPEAIETQLSGCQWAVVLIQIHYWCFEEKLISANCCVLRFAAWCQVTLLLKHRSTKKLLDSLFEPDIVWRWPGFKRPGRVNIGRETKPQSLPNNKQFMWVTFWIWPQVRHNWFAAKLDTLFPFSFSDRYQLPKSTTCSAAYNQRSPPSIPTHARAVKA